MEGFKEHSCGSTEHRASTQRLCKSLIQIICDIWHAQVGIPTPPVHELSVRGAKNMFTGNAAGSADLEVTLDMQVWHDVRRA